MSKIIYITESQYRNLIRHRIRRLNESSEQNYGYFSDDAGYFTYGKDPNISRNIARCKYFLDNTFERTTAKTYNNKRHITDVRCAILKRDLDNTNAKKYFDKDLMLELEDFCIENGMFQNERDYMNTTFIPFLINAWFKGMIKVK